MNTLQNAPGHSPTFTQFLFHNRWNRNMLYLAAAAIIIQLAIFKYLYPFASYIFGDSFTYLMAAQENLTINKYPVGYSKFLRLVSVFAKPDWVLVSLQYLLIQCGTFFLLFTIFYFHKTGKATQAVICCCMIFNPLILHLANLVSSDGLFLALSITWFALLLWIIHQPSNNIIFWHAIVLAAGFTVRYNALIYPVIALLAFWFSKLPLRKKVIGLGFALLLIGWFVGISMVQYKKLTGYWQFSPFSGWLLANNAMYAYQEVDPQDREPAPPKFQALDNSIRTFYDNNPKVESGETTTEFMWDPSFPLIRYCDSLFQVKDSTKPHFAAWAGMGPLYSSYGWFLIKKYPGHFLRYFFWPNALKYLAPPLEFLKDYNWGQPIVDKSAVKWFGYENNQVRTRTKNPRLWILQYYPFVVSMASLVMLLMLLAYLLLKGWQHDPAFYKTTFLAGLTWLAYSGFTIFSCSAALRFQAFPLLLSVVFAILLIDWITRFMQEVKLESQPQQTDNNYSPKAST